MVTLNFKKDQRYKLCTCGISKILPFCDNRHRKIKKKNNIVFNSIKITPKQNITLTVESKKWKIDEK